MGVSRLKPVLHGHLSLHEACVQGDLDEVKRCLKTSASVHDVSRSQQTALHVAAEWCNTEVCALLIKEGASLEAQDDWGDTPLHRAVVAGAVNNEMETAKYLVMQGASTTIENNWHHTPLISAKYHGGREYETVLRDAKARYDAQQVKQAIIDGLGTAWKPSDCKDELTPDFSCQPREIRKRKI